jgi:pimeloyl-ACP methyl ester carboxylesterase
VKERNLVPTVGGRRSMAAAAGLTGGVMAGSAAALTLASYVLRRLVTPERDRSDNVEILAVSLDETGDTVALGRTEETVAPGRYGMWLHGGRGHVRLGDIVAEDLEADAVTRVVEKVDAGSLRPGPARWNGYYYGGDPRQSLGLDFSDVLIPGPLGDMPAWLIPGAAEASGTGARWAVLVHGRGALRGECLRAVPVLHRLGITCLVVGYRNDEDAPSSGDRRYALGLAEWADVDAALRWAQDRGARRVTLFGWSMGGAIVLQTLSRSAAAPQLVDRVVLDAPVVDWNDVIRHHLRLGRMPVGMASVAVRVLRSTGARHLVGLDTPLDVAETNWTARARELKHPTLLIHSVDDEFVPVGPSVALARSRAGLVRYVRWTVARHTKEWNTDPDRWDRVVTEFLED